jgi:hypothetical protein
MNCSNCDTATPALPESGLCPICDNSKRGKKPQSSDPLVGYLTLMSIVLLIALLVAFR